MWACDLQPAIMQFLGMGGKRANQGRYGYGEAGERRSTLRRRVGAPTAATRANVSLRKAAGGSRCDHLVNVRISA